MVSGLSRFSAPFQPILTLCWLTKLHGVFSPTRSRVSEILIYVFLTSARSVPPPDRVHLVPPGLFGLLNPPGRFVFPNPPGFPPNPVLGRPAPPGRAPLGLSGPLEATRRDPPAAGTACSADLPAAPQACSAASAAKSRVVKSRFIETRFIEAGPVKKLLCSDSTFSMRSLPTGFRPVKTPLLKSGLFKSRLLKSWLLGLPIEFRPIESWPVAALSGTAELTLWPRRWPPSAEWPPVAAKRLASFKLRPLAKFSGLPAPRSAPKGLRRPSAETPLFTAKRPSLFRGGPTNGLFSPRGPREILHSRGRNSRFCPCSPRAANGLLSRLPNPPPSRLRKSHPGDVGIPRSRVYWNLRLRAAEILQRLAFQSLCARACRNSRPHSAADPRFAFPEPSAFASSEFPAAAIASLLKALLRSHPRILRQHPVRVQPLRLHLPFGSQAQHPHFIGSQLRASCPAPRPAPAAHIPRGECSHKMSHRAKHLAQLAIAVPGSSRTCTCRTLAGAVRNRPDPASPR